MRLSEGLGNDTINILLLISEKQLKIKNTIYHEIIYENNIYLPYFLELI